MDCKNGLICDERVQNSFEKIRKKKPEAYKRFMEKFSSMSEEEKKLFFDGYVYAISDMDDSQTTIEELEDAAHRIPTKYTDKILYCLCLSGRCYHGDLARAETIQLSDSGLTAVMKKILSCKIPLVEQTKEGKYKRYSLTEEGERYVRVCLLGEPDRIPEESETDVQISLKTTSDAVVEKETEIKKGDTVSREVYQKMDMDIEHTMRNKVRSL